MLEVVKVDGLRFVCSDALEVWRAKSLLTKEKGTIDWLRRNLRSGSVFCDIGANIGVYTLYAARLVGESGTVVACEPHIANAASLIRNVLSNRFEDRVKVITCSIGDSDEVADFNYNLINPGSSGSQLGHSNDENGKSFTPVLVETKSVVTLDTLLMTRSVIPYPTLVKIDVDGNEALVLRGMTRLLLSDRAPRSIQVEVHSSTKDQINKVMEESGYRFVRRHYTENGLARIQSGENPAVVPHNSIFEK